MVQLARTISWRPTRTPSVRIEQQAATTTGCATPEHDYITLKLTGSRAPAGIELGALDGFITHFLAALRDFDRHERGEPVRRQGTPDAAASAATALRLVSLRPGSAIAELEGIGDVAGTNAETLPLGDVPRARQVIDRLLDHLDQGGPLPTEVARSIESARRACGDDGTIELTTTTSGRTQRTVLIDRTTTEGLDGELPPFAVVTSVSGRLSRIAESPDRALIRSPDGTEWNCTYHEELADLLAPLWRSTIYATGEGERTSPRRGTFRLEHVASLLDDAQTALFSATPIDTDELLIGQGLREPQGLARVAARHAFTDDVEDAYLAAIFGDDE